MTSRTSLHLVLQDSGTTIPLTAFCLRQLRLTTPAARLHPSVRQDWLDVGDLADPLFDQPRSIDILLGAGVCPDVLQSDVLRRHDLIAQRTCFGWTLTGKAPGHSQSVVFTSHLAAADEGPPWHRNLVAQLQRFWSIEDVPQAVRQSLEDRECESIFATHRRASDGRYIVRLPLREGGRELLGDSYTGALGSLGSLRRRLVRDPLMAHDYSQFMGEYESLGHMRRLSDAELSSDSSTRPHYITHYGIYQRGDSGRKLRVVFNASRPTSSGYCLNDVLHAGPTLQRPLTSVLLRWRARRIAFCADVRMMFRQVWIDRRDVDLQRILWSPDPDVPPAHYQLLTVTYGASCSPYLALRTLQQLCSDEGHRWPAASSVVTSDRYADDILSGADDVDAARLLRDELIKLLESGGFPLRKWVANAPALLDDLPLEDRLRPTWHQVGADGPVDELGIRWDPVSDRLQLSSPALRPQSTKRTILADLARVFDPCGWLAPVLLVGKLLLQDLWRARLDWDEEIPCSMRQRWSDFITGLQSTPPPQMPRWIGRCPLSTLELHAFADASRRAMAAVIYSRTSSPTCETKVGLLLARTKLAPIRSLKPEAEAPARMTIPRLELRAALLASKLLLTAAKELDVPFEHCHIWSDFKIALQWIKSSKPADNALVDNYVAHIQELVPTTIWRHVPTNFNPADVASWGIDPETLRHHQLWWQGPAWLAEPPESWPPDLTATRALSTGSLESVSCACVAVPTSPPSFVDKFSDLGRLLRFVARLRRYVRLHRGGAPSPRVLDPLTAGELSDAFLACARLSQADDFPSELRVLERGEHLPKRHPMTSLDATLSQDGLIRVGGRLAHSTLSPTKRHPPILSGKSQLAMTIISWAHSRSLHGGFRLTYTHVARRAWIIGGARRVKSYLRQCVTCARTRAQPTHQLMAPLPAARVTPSRPFSRSGLDYAGPFRVLASKGRGVRTSKAYACIFVCLCTKAVHLELVGDLTTGSFLGAFTRFCGRRGRPAEIWSDNGTQFHRADLELREALRSAELKWDLIAGALADQGITWHFIPPGAPHFGGLWEAGVKSMKGHLRRVVGSRSLTFEEFSTVLVSIESVLNSRPLTPLSGESDDLDVLTPGHFLVGAPLTSVIEPCVASDRLDRLTHWELARGVRDQFWTRWSREYLHTLQQRSRWTTRQPNLAVGDLVIVIDPSLLQSSGRWPLGRITHVSPGQDGLVRAGTVRTSTGVYTRPVTKLARLLTSLETNPGPPEQP